MQRRRVIVLALLALVVASGVGLLWRARVARAELATLGPSLPVMWTAERVLGLDAWLLTPSGASLAVLVLAGATAGPLVLGRPQRLAPLVRGAVEFVLLAALGVGLLFADSSPVLLARGPWYRMTTLVGNALLGSLVLVLAGAVFCWMLDAWRELWLRPAGSTAEEASLVLYASAPWLVAVQTIGAEPLAEATPASVGLPTGLADAGALTATGCVLLAFGVIRFLRRGHVPAAKPAAG